jgi:tRNA pseudouridine55 synthase
MAEPLTGILVVDKPRGMTSHDVVSRVRRIAGQRRVGHAGTLDPIATGVLLVCLGEATRLSDELMAGEKWYLARIAFGARTDSDDGDGSLVEQSPVPDLDAILAGALQRMIGPLQQVPPQFAAIKRAGVPAYRHARAGKAVALEPRLVTIHSLALLGAGHATYTLRASTEPVAAPYVDLLIGCSKGTYVRAIARDLGEAAGCGAFMTALRRLASGCFTTRQSVTLEQLQQASAGGAADLRPLLLPPDSAVRSLGAAALGEDGARRALSGSLVHLDAPATEGLLRLYAPTGAFIGLASARQADAGAGHSAWHPDRVFVREV